MPICLQAGTWGSRGEAYSGPIEAAEKSERLGPWRLLDGVMQSPWESTVRSSGWPGKLAPGEELDLVCHMNEPVRESGRMCFETGFASFSPQDR